MIKKTKGAFYAVLSTMLALPVMVFAQYSTPTDSYGLADDTDANNIIETVLKWVLTFLGTLSILMIVIAGIMYITSGGDEARVDKAKAWLTYAVIGLIVALLGYAIVAAISQGLTT